MEIKCTVGSKLNLSISLSLKEAWGSRPNSGVVSNLLLSQLLLFSDVELVVPRIFIIGTFKVNVSLSSHAKQFLCL